MSFVTFSRAEKVNLAQLLNLVLGLNVNVDDKKLHCLSDTHNSTDEEKTAEVPESETVESSDNIRKRKTDQDDNDTGTAINYLFHIYIYIII